MNTHLHRLAIAALLLCGLVGALPVWQANPAELEVQHRDLMLGLLSATLVLSAFVPRLRLPALVASVLSKVAFLAVAVTTGSSAELVSQQVFFESALTAILLAAGVVLWREARQDARWHGMLRLGPEV
jgi:hypothetical protein